MEKLPKLILFGSTSLMGWLLPASMSFSTPIQGFSLASAFVSSLVLVAESKRTELQSRFTNSERSFQFERLATEMAYQQQLELDELERQYFPQPDYADYPLEQPQLPGAHWNQQQLPSSYDSTEENKYFNLEWLLSSNSHHALLCGDTGAGKTLLARWLLGQLGITDVTVLDPDDDGQTWKGFHTVGTDDDWKALDQAYLDSLAEFNQRTPNDRTLTPKGYVLEELPDHLIECKNSEKVLGRLLRRGRKRRVFVLAITQDCNKEAIKLSAPLRGCFTTFYLQGYAYHALKHLVPGSDRPVLLPSLKACKRPALVQFKGSWFVWDVPEIILSTSTQGFTSTSTNTIAPNNIATLNKCLDAPVATELHWKVVDFAMAQGKPVSVREVMRACSVRTADETKTLFQELVGLEFGTTLTEGDRILFEAYQ